MRSVSGTLEAAQISGSRTPYISMLFTSYDGGTTYDLSSDGGYGDRIVLIDHLEEPYNDYAYVMLRNYDRGLPEDLNGFWVEIGYGDDSEYSQTARMWVKHQQMISAGGKLITILELEGMWSKLRETKLRIGDPPYYTATFATDTVLTILGTVLGEIDPAMSLADLGTQNDGIINSYTPSFSINEVEYFEDAANVVYRLLKMTKSFLRSRSGLEFEVRYPQESDEVDLEIYSEGSDVQVFYEYINRSNLTIPNHIYCIANAGEDGLWTNIIVAEATEQDSIDAYGDVPDITLAPDIDNGSSAEDRAGVVLTRIIAEQPGGSMTLPHDCRIELYDLIKAYDYRGVA